MEEILSKPGHLILLHYPIIFIIVIVISIVLIPPVMKAACDIAKAK